MKLIVASKVKAARYFSDIAGLVRLIWPNKGPAVTIKDDINALKKFNKGQFERHIILFDQNKVIGYARLFKRKISIDNKLVNNMALASVCVRPDYQGQGLGRKIVRKAFEFIKNGTFICSVFQTKVPDFYIRLGAKIIKNKIVNSFNSNKNPFWDPHVMIYPKKMKIPNGTIDLRGNGY